VLRWGTVIGANGGLDSIHMKRVIIVDLSNLRERAPGKEKVLHYDYKGQFRRISLAEWNYIYDCVNNLAGVAPGSAIYLVTDKSTRYHFVNRRQGMRIFDANAKLPCEDPWHMYPMPTKKEVGSWLGDGDGNEGVEADELILYLAAQLGGFVVSQDFFREEKYKDSLAAIQHRVFWPARALDESDWYFVDSYEIRKFPNTERFNVMHTLPNIQAALADLPKLEKAQIGEIRNAICETGGLIDRFWLEYREAHTLRASRSKPINAFRDLHGPEFRKPKPAVRTSSTLSFGEVIKQNIGISPPTDDGVEEDLKVPLVLACDPELLSRHVDRVVRVIGRLRQHNNITHLEWFPGDSRVRLNDQVQDHLIQADSFVGILGCIVQRDAEFFLRSSRDSEIRSYSFAEIIQLVEEKTSAPVLSTPRRWNLPRLPSWRSFAGLTLTPASTGITKRPVSATATATQPVDKEWRVYNPPQPARLNARLATSIAIAAAIVTVAVGLLIRLW